MAKRKDPEDIASIQRSIAVNPKDSRRVRCHRLRELFGFQAWTVAASALSLRCQPARPAISAGLAGRR